MPIWPAGSPPSSSAWYHETMAVLGITDLAPLLERTPVLDPAAALAEAGAWVAARDPAERPGGGGPPGCYGPT